MEGDGVVRAGIYVRISEDRGGAGQGVARQEADCRTLAERKGWEIVKVYADNDVSATRSKVRPQYDQLLSDLDAELLTGVVVWDLDRLHRRPLELEHFITLADAKGVQLATVGGEVDLATDHGRMIARIMGAVAANEAGQIKKRVLRKQEQLREQGKPFGGGIRPYGYAANRIDVIPEEAAIIRECAERVLDAQSLGSIVRNLNDRGVMTVSQKREIELKAAGKESKPGSPWSITSVRTMLTRQRHIGVLTYKGARVDVATKWEKILDEVTFERVQAVLNDPDRGRYLKGNRNKYLLSGIAVCGVCGTTMGIAFDSQNAPRPNGPRYKCRARSACVSVNQARLDQFVFREWLGTGLGQFRLEPGHSEERSEGEIQDEISQLDRRLLQIAEELADDPDFNLEQVRAMNRRINDRLRELRQQIAELNRQRLEAAAMIVPDEAVAATWDQWPLDVRRQILRASIESLVVNRTTRRGRGLDEARVAITWRE